MNDKPLQIADHFPVITADMDVHTLPWTGGMEFYQGLTQRFGSFQNHVLVSCHTFDAAWPTWEMHPRGDEIVILLQGRATLALLEDGQARRVALAAPGDYVVVPRGAWHTATDAAGARMLFITPGEGTENRVDPHHPDPGDYGSEQG